MEAERIGWCHYVGAGEGALTVMFGGLGAGAFATLGGLISGAVSSDETLHLAGKSDL